MIRRAYYRQCLRDYRWKERRKEIMRREGFRCRRCGAKGRLNVHHRWYIYGRMPWQYPDRCLITLCEKCHRHVHFMQAFWRFLFILLAAAAVFMFMKTKA